MAEETKNISLRFGPVTDLYYSVTGEKPPRQLDLIESWFPGLLVTERESDGTVKQAPEYVDTEYRIYATRYHDYLYVGDARRVQYIIGQLIGTSRSNREKERRTAEMIRRNIARVLSVETLPMPALFDYMTEKLDALNEEQTDQLHKAMWDYCIALAEEDAKRTQWEKDNEPAPMDEEVFSQVIYNAVFQLDRFDWAGFVNGWMWLLTGSFLRNEAGRLTRTYDSFWIPVHKEPSETGTLQDKLYYLFRPEDYEDYYFGDDTTSRFPGIEWYCDNCNDHLNQQDGFDDHLPVWQCRKCGHLNPIDEEHQYQNKDDYRLKMIQAEQDSDTNED